MGYAATFHPVDATLIAWTTTGGRPMRFLILQEPTPTNLADYIATLSLYNVTDVVRVSSGSCGAEQLGAHFRVHTGPGWSYPDGDNPGEEVLGNWMQLVDTVFDLRPRPGRKTSRGLPPGPVQHPPIVQSSVTKEPCIAVHCVAGLGRAPVLVAVALVERGGAVPLGAVEHIRSLRKGCFNSQQLGWVRKYKPTRGGSGGCCAVM